MDCETQNIHYLVLYSKKFANSYTTQQDGAERGTEAGPPISDWLLFNSAPLGPLQAPPL